MRSAARFGGIELSDTPICDTCGGSISPERSVAASTDPPTLAFEGRIRGRPNRLGLG